MHVPETDHSLSLQPGQQIRLTAAAGALIVCADGTVSLLETAARRSDDWSVLPAPMRMPLAAGQVHRVEQAAVVALYTQGGARLLYVAAPSPFRRWLRARVQAISKYAIIFFFRRGVEQSGSSSGS